MSTKLHNQINQTSQLISKHADLKQLHVKFFCHDMTFGDGAASLLSTNPDVPIFYHEKRQSLVYTDKGGRILCDGIYLSSYLLDNNPAYTKLMQFYYKTFGFQHILHFVKNENGRQHFYSFSFDCDQSSFTHLVMNNLHRYQEYISNYHKACYSIIEQSSEVRNQILLPFSDVQVPEDLQLLLSKKLTSDSNMLDLFHGADHDAKIDVYLSAQQIKCFQYLLQGMTSREIASYMNLSHRTVEHYIAKIKIKLHCKSTRELIARFSGHPIK